MEERKLLEQIDQWNGDDEFSHCIEDIEAIPEKEHSYLLTFKLNCAYSNLAVLGYHSAHREVNENLLWYSIELLEYVRSQGEIDSYWNAYMGYANVILQASPSLTMNMLQGLVGSALGKTGCTEVGSEQ